MNKLNFISDGFKGFVRNGVKSAAAVLILGSTLLLVGIFLTLIIVINMSVDNIDDFNEIVVYMKTDTPEETIKLAGEKIASLNNVKEGGVTFVSKADSLESEKNKFPGYENIFDSYDSETNPLPDSFKIEFENVDDVEALVYNLNHLDIDGDGNSDNVVDKVKNRYDIAKNIQNFKNAISICGSWLMLLLIFVSLFVISNTIRLTYHAREMEITVMRYIGATKTYITLPFMVEGAFIGLTSGLAGYLVQLYIFEFPVAELAQKFDGFIVIPSISEMNMYFIPIFFGAGLILGILGSAFAIRKYLKA